MCTVTLHRGVDSYLVTMNRDELRSRGPESPPSIERSGDRVWLGPRDEERGGTWIGVNDRSLCACLLNANLTFEALSDRIRPGMRTRGDIVPGVMAHEDLASASWHIENELRLEEFAPFMLLIVSPEASRLYLHDGESPLSSQRLTGNWSLVTSSNWQMQEVLAKRQELFNAWEEIGCPHLAAVPMYNLIRMPDGESWSPMMEREHSTTRSVTQVTSRRNETPGMRYSVVRELRIDLEEYRLETAYSGSQ